MRYATPHGYHELNPFPGCNQLVVSNHAFVWPQHRGQGHGKAEAKARIELARSLGYSYMMATVRADNAVQLYIMESLGWKELDSFYNDESGATITLWGLLLAPGCKA